MTYYQTATMNDTQDLTSFFDFVNRTADGAFFITILFVIWIVSFLAIKQYSTPKAWTFASLFCSILAILLAILNMISPKFMYVFFIFTAIGLVWLKLEPS